VRITLSRLIRSRRSSALLRRLSGSAISFPCSAPVEASLQGAHARSLGLELLSHQLQPHNNRLSLQLTGVRRTLSPPTTPLESHPCAMRACKAFRMIFLCKSRGRGSHYVNQPLLSPSHPEICSPPQNRYIGTCFPSPPEWYRHAIVARNSPLQYDLHAGVARKRLRPR
jgi:hypothetical protein